MTRQEPVQTTCGVRTVVVGLFFLVVAIVDIFVPIYRRGGSGGGVGVGVDDGGRGG